MKQKTFNTLSTLPIWNFFKIKNSGQIIYLLDIEDHTKTHITKKEITFLHELWEKLDTEFIDRFAMNQEFINRCLIEKTILLLKLEEITSSDPFIKNRIKAEELKLKENTNKKEKFDIDKTVGVVEKYMSFQIDIFKTPIAKLYSYINQMQEQALKNA